jgi:heme/copper-type cytochrome/quinol oxidase subunit 2
MNDFTRSFLLLFSGPIVWAGHFLAIYTVNGIACARPEAQAAWLGMPASLWLIAGLSLLAIAAIAWVIFHLRSHGGREGDQDHARFIRKIGTLAGVLAIGAIVVETVPVFIVPMCG